MRTVDPICDSDQQKCKKEQKAIETYIASLIERVVIHTGHKRFPDQRYVHLWILVIFRADTPKRVQSIAFRLDCLESRVILRVEKLAQPIHDYVQQLSTR